MAALSKGSILENLGKQDLIISPILTDEQVGPSSVDLRMGTIVLIARAGRQSHVEPAAYISQDKHQRAEDRKQKHERFVVPFLESFLLHPGSLALVPTFEWIRVPTTLQGVVTARFWK